MNARISLLHARMAPAALAAAIALAFGLSAPAQAQYSYPGTASSSKHAAKAAPRAEPRERPAYGAAPTHYGYGNPSMQKGEACPPGSTCASRGPNQQAYSGGAAPSSAYGTHESYGYATSPTSVHQTAAPASRSATVGPVRAGSERGAMNYGPSAASNANFRNSVTGKSGGPNMNPTGQPTSFIGPNGQQVNLNGMSNPSITGPNGQKVGMDGPDLNHLGGGHGQQKGSGMNMGGTVSYENGSGSETRTGSGAGMANGGPQFNNGGTAGVSDEADGGNNKLKGWDKNPDGTQKEKGLVDSVEDAAKGAGDAIGKEWDHLTSSGPPPATDMKPGETRPVGPPKRGGGSKDEADMGPTAGPGELVSGTGQVATPGKHKGQDGGGGQGKDGGSTSGGGQNAQGQYIAPSGQDAPVKPKEVGTLKMNYNGKNGAIDPKLNGSNGGGG